MKCKCAEEMTKKSIIYSEELSILIKTPLKYEDCINFRVRPLNDSLYLFGFNIQGERVNGILARKLSESNNRYFKLRKADGLLKAIEDDFNKDIYKGLYH